MQAAFPHAHTYESDQPASRGRRRWSPLGDGPVSRKSRALAPSLVLWLALALAFPFTARSLWTGLQTDIPLAYQGLIPLLAFATAVIQSRRKPSYVWRDSVTELIAALPFLLTALGLMYGGSRLGSIYFWYNRGDLLALACFGVGAAIIVFGLGAVTRSWFAVLYLFLIWPAPYQDALGQAINHITQITVLGVDSVLHQFSWPGIVATSQEAVYQITGPNQTTQLVGIDSPCAGASSMFGFLVIGIPAMYLLSGKIWKKALWLTAGIVLLWTFNVGRIFGLFAVATKWGVDTPYFWWTHATLGLILFGVAMAVMIVVGVLLKFRFERETTVMPSAPTMLRVRRTSSTPLLMLLLIGISLVVGVFNQGIVDAVGLSTRLATGHPIPAFQATLPAYERVEPVFVDQYDWSKPFFGRNSTYQRFKYQVPGQPTIWVDSVLTDDRKRLDLFNVQGCYNFHGFNLAAVSTIDIGMGIVGQQLQFVVPDSGRQWIALTWTWPVERNGEQMHERITILQYVEGDANTQIVNQQSALSAFERLFGIGNGRVAVSPQASHIFQAAQAIVASQVHEDRASQ